MDETNVNRPEMDNAIAQPAKPGPLLLIGSFIVFAACILVVSVATVLFSLAKDIGIVMGALLLLAPALTLGISQYRAIVRHRAEAARVAAGVLVALTGLLATFNVLAVLTGVTLAVTENLLTSIEFTLGIGAFCLLQARANTRWANELDRESQDPTIPPAVPRFQLSIREMLGLMTVVALVGALTMSILEYNRF